MASSKKKTAQAETTNTDVKEEEVVEVVEVVDDAAKEETKEENTSVEIKEDDVETSEEIVPEVAPEEAPRKKRKYTKRASKTADGKTAEKASAKKSKKDAKAVENVQEVYIEYGNNKILSEEVIDRIKQAYKSEGHRISSIKNLKVYMNLDEGKAYYVINDKAEGKYVEF